MKDIVGSKYKLELFSDGTKAYLKGGNFREIFLTETPLFRATLHNTVTEESVEISSSSEFNKVVINEYEAKRELYFHDPAGVRGGERDETAFRQAAENALYRQVYDPDG